MLVIIMQIFFQIIYFLKYIVTLNRRNASYRPGNTNYLNEDLQASIQDLPFWFKVNKNTYSRILWVYANTYVCIHFYMSVFLSESGTTVFAKVFFRFLHSYYLPCMRHMLGKFGTNNIWIIQFWGLCNDFKAVTQSKTFLISSYSLSGY